MSFFKVMRFYMSDKNYTNLYKTTPLDALFEADDGRLAKTLVEFMRSSAQFFHKGLDFEYNQRITGYFS